MTGLAERESTMTPAKESRRFLIGHWDGGGNTPPILAIVRRLIAKGHQVHVVTDPSGCPEVEATGATAAPWTRAPHRVDRTEHSDPLKDWEVSSPPALLARLRDRVLFGPALAYAKDFQEQIDAFKPDLIAVSDMLFGPMIAAEHSGIPTVSLSANIWIWPVPGAPPFGPGVLPAKGPLGRLRDKFLNALTRNIFGKATSSYNQARAAFGLAPLHHPMDQLDKLDRHLVLTSRAFEYPGIEFPSKILFTGPELADPVWAGPWNSPWPFEDMRPLVLVGFSSTFQDQEDVLERVIHALGRLPVRAVVTLGPALNTLKLATPSNVHLCASAPHGILLREAAVMITHAGHGSVMRGLANGVPLLCIPMGRDQNDNSARVAAHGAGIRLKPSSSPEEIEIEVGRLLRESKYRTAAQQLGARIQEDARKSRTIDILEEAAERHTRVRHS